MRKKISLDSVSSQKKSLQQTAALKSALSICNVFLGNRFGFFSSKLWKVSRKNYSMSWRFVKSRFNWISRVETSAEVLWAKTSCWWINDAKPTRIGCRRVHSEPSSPMKSDQIKWHWAIIFLYARKVETRKRRRRKYFLCEARKIRGKWEKCERESEKLCKKRACGWIWMSFGWRENVFPSPRATVSKICFWSSTTTGSEGSPPTNGRVSRAIDITNPKNNPITVR